MITFTIFFSFTPLENRGKTLSVYKDQLKKKRNSGEPDWILRLDKNLDRRTAAADYLRKLPNYHSLKSRRSVQTAVEAERREIEAAEAAFEAMEQEEGLGRRFSTRVRRPSRRLQSPGPAAETPRLSLDTAAQGPARGTSRLPAPGSSALGSPALGSPAPGSADQDNATTGSADQDNAASGPGNISQAGPAVAAASLFQPPSQENPGQHDILQQPVGQRSASPPHNPDSPPANLESADNIEEEDPLSQGDNLDVLNISQLGQRPQRRHFDWSQPFGVGEPEYVIVALDSFQAFLHERSLTPEDRSVFTRFANSFVSDCPEVLESQTQEEFYRRFKDGFRSWCNLINNSSGRSRRNPFSSNPGLTDRVRTILQRIRTQSYSLRGPQGDQDAGPSQPLQAGLSQPLQAGPSQPLQAVPGQPLQAVSLQPTQAASSQSEAVRRRQSANRGREVRLNARNGLAGGRLPTNRAEEEQLLRDHMMGSR